MTLGEIGGAIEIGNLLDKVRRFIKSKYAPQSNDISQPSDRKLFLQEFVKKCNSRSKYRLTRECILLHIKDFHYFETTLLSDVWIQQHQLDEAVIQHHFSSSGKKETKQIVKNLRDVYIQELGHTPYETVITFGFSNIWRRSCSVKYENDRVVDEFRFRQYGGHFRPFERDSQELHNTGAKYNLYAESAYFCGSCLGSVPIPIFCTTSNGLSGGFDFKKDSLGYLFHRLMLSPLRERNWAVMIIEWIAGLVASSYRASKSIPIR